MPKKLPVAFDPIRKQTFVEGLTMGLGPIEAVRNAGFDGRLKTVAERLMEDEDVQQMISEYTESLKAKYDVSRESVLKHLIDAMEIAKIQADPKGMVMALKEISEVMGHHAPKQVAVEQHHTVERTDVKRRIRQIPDARLLELAGEDGFEVVDLLPITVDGEFTEVEK